MSDLRKPDIAPLRSGSPLPQAPLAAVSASPSTGLSPSIQQTYNEQQQHQRRNSGGSSYSSRRTSTFTPPPPPLDPSVGPQRLPRQPSSDFTELHNDMEIEQEAAVNRLLNMIRLQQINNANNDDAASSTGATMDSASVTTGRARSPGLASTTSGLRHSLSRQSSFGARRSASRASSTHASSPAVGSSAAGLGITTSEEAQWLLGGSRDEASFYMVETQMLKRENEMLMRRIRELERQVANLNKNGSTKAGESAIEEDDQPASVAPIDNSEDKKEDKEKKVDPHADGANPKELGYKPVEAVASPEGETKA